MFSAQSSEALEEVQGNPIPLPSLRRPLNSIGQDHKSPVPAKQQKLELIVKKYERYTGIKQRKLDNSTD